MFASGGGLDILALPSRNFLELMSPSTLFFRLASDTFCQGAGVLGQVNAPPSNVIYPA